MSPLLSEQENQSETLACNSLFICPVLTDPLDTLNESLNSTFISLQQGKSLLGQGVFTSQKLTAPGPHRLQLLSSSASKVAWWSFMMKGDIGPCWEVEEEADLGNKK